MKQSFKIQSKNPALIVCVDATGAIVNVGLNKQPLEFLRLNKLAIDADVDLDVQMSNDNRLMCTAYAKVDRAMNAALKLQAERDKAIGTSAQYARLAAGVEEGD